jgi:hypothetical protein
MAVTRYPFQVGLTLSDALRLLSQHWVAIVSAFILLRALPRVVIGEDMDAGLLGDNYSIIANLLAPLNADTANLIAEKIMSVPNILFQAAAVVILLDIAKGARRLRFSLALLVGLIYAAVETAFDATVVELPYIPKIMAYIAILIFFLAFALSDCAAASEKLWPHKAFMRSVQLARRGAFRLLVLVVVVMAIYLLSEYAEDLLLTAIPVTDATWFDWFTTIIQEIISGFYLPFSAAIFVSAFLHLRLRRDGEKPQDVAAVFD